MHNIPTWIKLLKYEIHKPHALLHIAVKSSFNMKFNEFMDYTIEQTTLVSWIGQLYTEIIVMHNITNIEQ